MVPAFRPWPHGDPPVLLDAILSRVDATKQQQLVGMYLESVASTLEAQLKLVQGMRTLVAPHKT